MASSRAVEDEPCRVPSMTTIRAEAKLSGEYNTHKSPFHRQRYAPSPHATISSFPLTAYVIIVAKPANTFVQFVHLHGWQTIPLDSKNEGRTWLFVRGIQQHQSHILFPRHAQHPMEPWSPPTAYWPMSRGETHSASCSALLHSARDA